MMEFSLDRSIEVLERTPAVLRAMLGGLSDAWGMANRGEETFSPFDVVGHLIHGDRVDWIPRARRILEHGDSRRFDPFDRFAIVSIRNRGNDPNAINKLRDTSYAACYYPWIEVRVGSGKKSRWIPPSGHVAGAYVKVDSAAGVWKAPANVRIDGILNLEHVLCEETLSTLNHKNVNCLKDLRAQGRGLRIWGARTMSGDAEWRYVNVRRLVIFIEESIAKGIQWAVFEPNAEPTGRE